MYHQVRETVKSRPDAGEHRSDPPPGQSPAACRGQTPPEALPQTSRCSGAGFQCSAGHRDVRRCSGHRLSPIASFPAPHQQARMSGAGPTREQPAFPEHSLLCAPRIPLPGTNPGGLLEIVQAENRYLADRRTRLPGRWLRPEVFWRSHYSIGQSVLLAPDDTDATSLAFFCDHIGLEFL